MQYGYNVIKKKFYIQVIIKYTKFLNELFKYYIDINSNLWVQKY